MNKAKEIHLGRVLAEHRRSRGITQEQLAAHLGVSKAAVSKWETGTACPDIFLLPRLAAYFDLSIDELMGYHPQMDKEEIRRWHIRLAREFLSLPFEEVLGHCRELAREYFSCYPLLFRIGALLVNHAALAGSPEKSKEVLEEARRLFLRVRQNSTDLSLCKEALKMDAYCLLSLNRPREALSLLEQETASLSPAEPLLASAYQMLGRFRESRQILQTGIYRELLLLLNLLSSYLDRCRDYPEAFAKTCDHLLTLIRDYSLEQLHPGLLLSCYLCMARGWAMQGDREKTLRILETYTDLAAGSIYPLQLRGDSYFDLIDGWLHDLGDYPPRDEAIIRRSMTEAVTREPAFAFLAKEPRFRNITARLKKNEEVC